MTLGKRKEPDFIPAGQTPMSVDPTDNDLSTVDQGQDFVAGTPQEVLAPDAGGTTSPKSE